MHLTLLLAVSLAVASAASLQGHAVQDPVTLPDFEFTVPGPRAAEVKLTEGKLEGLSKFPSADRDCYGRYTCDLWVSGLRVTYKAVATKPDKRFDVVVDVLHGLLRLYSGRTPEGDFAVRKVRVISLDQYVREPAQFDEDRQFAARFDEELKKNLLETLLKVAQEDVLNRVLDSVLGKPTSRQVVRSKFDVPGKPYQTLVQDHVAFPDFTLSVPGAPARNVEFTKGKAGPISEVLKHAKSCLGFPSCTLSLSGLRVTYAAVATQPREVFDSAVTLVQGVVEVALRKANDGTVNVSKVNLHGVKFNVEHPEVFTVEDREQNRHFEEALENKLLKFLGEFVGSRVFEDAVKKILGVPLKEAKTPAKETPEVTGKPFEDVHDDHVALPGFHFSVPGATVRNVELTAGKAGPLSKVLKLGRGSLGRFSYAVLLQGLRISYKASANNPEEQFPVVLDVLHGVVEVKSSKDGGDEYKLENVVLKDLRLYVEKPAEFSTDPKQNVLFEQELHKKLFEVLEAFAKTPVFHKDLMV